MNEDSYVNTRTVVGPVTTTLEINSAFDTITYNKGSSILRMLESTIGELNFRTGLTVGLSIIFTAHFKVFTQR